MLFDVLPDDRGKSLALSHRIGSEAGARPANYLRVIDPSDTQVAATNVLEPRPSDLSRFEAPTTVRVSASRPAQGNEFTLHFVNYNREEPADKRKSGSGIKDEKPITTPVFAVDFKLPANFASPDRTPQVSSLARNGQGEWHVIRVEFISPEAEQTRELEFKQVGSRLRFRLPEFLVYGVVRVQLSKSQ